MRLIKSQRFWTAILGVVSVVALEVTGNELSPEAIGSITAIIVALIGGYSYRKPTVLK